MAEIAQNKLQESKAIKGKTPYTAPAKRSYETPDDSAGYVQGLKSKAYTEKQRAIGSLGLIGAKLNEGRERIIGEKIKEEMDEHNRNVMFRLERDAKNTTIENLDFQEMLWGWEDRHTKDFMVGANGADGLPSVLIKDKPLDEYDLPSTQLRDLKNHYNNLEKTTEQWLFTNIPEIQQKKDLFYLTRKAVVAQNKIEAILRNDNNFEGGIDSIFTQDEGEQVVDRATGIPIIFNKTPYTNELGALAQQEINKILSDYDLEIAKRMDAGTLPLEDAINFQRKFSEQILDRIFNNDKRRNPEETFLKVKNHGYWIERDIAIGRSASQKAIMQKVVLPSINTDTFMNSWSEKQHRELDAEQKKTDKDAILTEGLKYKEIITDPDFLDNPSNTIQTVIKGFRKLKYSAYEAQLEGLNWLNMNRIHDEGINKELSGNILEQIGVGFQRRSEEMVNLLSKQVGEDRIALDQSQLQNIILKEYGGKFRKPDGNHYTKKEQQEAVKLISKDMIQKLISNKIAYDIGWELDVYTNQLNGMLITDGGQGYLARQFFEWNKDKDEWVLREEGHTKGSFHNHPNRKRFQSDAHFGSVLMKLQNKMNAEYHSSKSKKTTQQLDIDQSKRFEDFMRKYSGQQTSTFYNMTRLVEPEQMEELANKGDTSPYLTWMMRDTALAGGMTEKQFEAVPLDKREAEFLTQPQIKRYHAVKRDFEQLAKYTQMSLPHHASTLAELKLNYKAIHEDSQKQGIDNTYTAAAIKFITPILEKRIMDMHPHEYFETAMKECENDRKCAFLKLDEQNIPVEEAVLFTKEQSTMGKSVMGID